MMMIKIITTINLLCLKDTYYRIHVIDCLPNVWVLDGRLVTSAERLQVQQFFEDSALSQRPVVCIFLHLQRCKNFFYTSVLKYLNQVFN